ncbi:hypothetical protein K0651_13145 [Ornithinimicrobium sp. Arc0846-15]|nr:hypothetical protein [Ornithinimicrobium laminariae]
MGQPDIWHFAENHSALGLEDFLPELLEENSISEVQTRTLTRGPSLQGRASDERVLRVASQARSRSQKSDMPFWEAMMAMATDEAPAVRRAIFREALYHRSDADDLDRNFVPTLEFVSTLRGAGFCESHERGITALTSVVSVSGEERHLPLLDFRVSPSEFHTELITELLTILGERGYLVDSGRSYHFYGARTASAEDFWAFLGRAQLMAPFVDERWIAHQLISARASLRLSTNSVRHLVPPRLVAWSDGLRLLSPVRQRR